MDDDEGELPVMHSLVFSCPGSFFFKKKKVADDVDSEGEHR